MKITVLTMFPRAFDSFVDTPVLKRAVCNEAVEFRTVDIKDFADGSFRKIDDSPCGGGPGMVVRVDTLNKALESVRTPLSHVVLLSPKGVPYTQGKAHELASMKDVILVCGHYEGVDARFERYVDEQISMGDFILTGGEIAAMAVADSVVRLLKGSLRDGSADDESFERIPYKDCGFSCQQPRHRTALLEYPQYTHPVVYNGDEVPAVLLSGDQRAIGKWKMAQSIMETVKNRPDLLKEAIDTVGKSNASIYMFDMPRAVDSMVLKVEQVSESSTREYEALSWLDGRLPVPKVVGHHVSNDMSYILMSKTKGRMLCDPSILSNRRRLLKSAAAALRTLWSVDVDDCPLDSCLDRDLEIASYNVEHGNVGKCLAYFTLDSSQGLSIPKGVESVADLLDWLRGHRPKVDGCDVVLSHGDLCLPNVLVDCKGIAGFVDLGGAGRADRWRDIAVCLRSLRDNLVGCYAAEYAAKMGQCGEEPPFGPFDDGEFFDVLGIQPNEEKLRYYTLLDTLM